MHKKPIITLIGAGSLFFGRQAIWAMLHLDGLKGGTLRLVDTNPKNAERMLKLAEIAGNALGHPSRFESYTDYRKALPGSDFVVLSFSKDNAKFRKIDCEISAKYGIRMCSGDTIGPGGVFRTLREYRPIMEIAKAIETLCPEAWLINYVNPSAVFGILLRKVFKGNQFALCDAQHLPYFKEKYLKLIGEDPNRHEELELRVGGVNHFTFMLSATLAGQDILPRIHAAFHELAKNEKPEGYSKGRYNNGITAQLGDVFGALPTVTGHTKEYVPYYQGRAPISENVPPLAIFDADERKAITEEMWNEIDGYLDGSAEIAEFHAKYKSDHATDIINSMCVEDGKSYYINVPNQSRDGSIPVPNLPEDAVLELQCTLDAKGPNPQPTGLMPIGLRALQMQIIDCHQLTVEACLQQDRNLLLRALAMDPLVNSIATADAVINELYEAQKSVIEPWVAKKTILSKQPTGDLGESIKMY